MRMKKWLTVLVLTGCFVLGAVNVLNCGIGGQNSRHGVNRLDALLKQYRPQILIIGFGGNDVLNSKALIEETEYRANIEKMIDAARRDGVRVIVLNTVSPAVESYLKERHQYPFNESLNVRIERYNRILREIAAARGVLLNDFHKLVSENGGATEQPESLVRNQANSRSRDGLHLTGPGARMLGESVAAILSGQVKPGDTVLCLGDSLTYGAGLPGAGTSTGSTYPAWLEAKLNNRPAPLPPAAKTGAPARTLNGGFGDDTVGQVPSGWALSRGSGVVSVQQDGERKFISLAPAKDKTAFLRTDILPVIPGKYRVTLLCRGAGLFNVSGMVYPAQSNKPQSLAVSKEWGVLTGQWSEHVFEFEIPGGHDRFCLVLRQRDGNGNFAAIQMDPAGNKTAFVLKNKNMKVRFFRPEDGGGIAGVADARGVEFVNRRPSGILWEVRMKKIKFDAPGLPPVITLSIDPEQDDGTSSKNEDAAGNDLIFTSADAVRMGARCEVDASPEKLEFRWKNLKIGEDPDMFDVRVTFELGPDDLFCMADGGFENRSGTYTVFYFAMPQLDGLGAVHNAPQDDCLATPFFHGRLVRNPTEKGLLGKNRLFQPNRSGHSMQFDVLYNNGSGLYLASFDPDQYAKRYLLEASPAGGLKWALFNIPDNMRRVPQNWRMPYRAGFRTFRGDWYDGCMIYREWALKQYWSAGGPLATRDNIPRWFKEIDEWFQFGSPDIRSKFDFMEKFYGEFKEYNLGAWLTHWGLDNTVFHGMNPERFPLTETDRKAFAYFKERRIPVMGYIQCTSWNDATESYRKHPDADANLVRNYYGQKLKWGNKSGHDGQELIAYPGELWRQVLGDAVVRMAEAGFSAVYLDSGNHGGTYLNFTPECSDESGGGVGYVKQNQRLLSEIRDRARRVNPDFCLNAESFWEGNIAFLDGFLTCNTTNAYLSDDRVAPVPMVQAVYHDYALMYSAWTGRGDTERDNARGYVAKHALAFCWGVKPGWNILNLLYKYPNHEEALRTSKLRYEGYVKGKKYLVFGRMLREPPAADAVPLIPVKWHIGYGMRYYDVLMAKVLKSAWAAPDGGFALVLYNIDEEPQALTLVLNKKEYRLGPGKFSPLYPVGLVYEMKDDGDVYRLEITIPPRSPAILEFVPAGN